MGSRFAPALDKEGIALFDSLLSGGPLLGPTRWEAQHCKQRTRARVPPANPSAAIA